MFGKNFEIKWINDDRIFNAKPAADPPEVNVCRILDYNADCTKEDRCGIDI